jgi:hypothetical protein
MNIKFHQKLGIYQCWCCFLVVTILISTERTIKAQTPIFQNYTPGLNQPPSTQPLPTPTLPSRLPPPQLLPLTPTGVPPAEQSIFQGEVPPAILVKKIQVTGSTIFSSKDFAKITQPYTKKYINDLFSGFYPIGVIFF